MQKGQNRRQISDVRYQTPGAAGGIYTIGRGRPTLRLKRIDTSRNGKTGSMWASTPTAYQFNLHFVGTDVPGCPHNDYAAVNSPPHLVSDI